MVNRNVKKINLFFESNSNPTENLRMNMNYFILRQVSRSVVLASGWIGELIYAQFGSFEYKLLEGRFTFLSTIKISAGTPCQRRHIPQVSYVYI